MEILVPFYWLFIDMLPDLQFTSWHHGAGKLWNSRNSFCNIWEHGVWGWRYISYTQVIAVILFFMMFFYYYITWLIWWLCKLEMFNCMWLFIVKILWFKSYVWWQIKQLSCLALLVNYLLTILQTLWIKVMRIIIIFASISFFVFISIYAIRKKLCFLYDHVISHGAAIWHHLLTYCEILCYLMVK